MIATVFLLVGLLTACEPDTITPNPTPTPDKPNTEQPDSGNNGSNGGGSITPPVTPKPDPVAPAVSTWHWGSDTNPYGINFVVNDSKKAEEVLTSYKAYNVKRVYGGYSMIPGHPTQKVNLMNWNRLLKSNGIRSVYLIGSAQWIYPENRQAMLDHISKYYVAFNREADSDSRLQGLHLDVEPHQLAEWKSASMARKRELLLLLRDVYADVRALLVANGMGSDEVAADIPVWFDNLSSIGWTSEADRDAWFRDVAAKINGLSLMAYEVGSVPTLLSRTEWERTRFGGPVEVGLNASEVGSVWSSKQQLLDALSELHQGTGKWVAIHHYSHFMGL